MVQQYNLIVIKINVTFPVVGTAVQLEYPEKKRNISCGTAVQLEYPEEKRNIAFARGPYPALFVHSCLAFPPFPVVQQFNWSTLKRNVSSSKRAVPLATFKMNQFKSQLFGTNFFEIWKKSLERLKRP